MFINPFALAAATTRTMVALTDAAVAMNPVLSRGSAQDGPDAFGRMCETMRNGTQAASRAAMQSLGNGSN